MLSALVAEEEEEEEGGCDFVDGREPDPRRSWEDLPGVGGVTLFVIGGPRTSWWRERGSKTYM